MPMQIQNSNFTKFEINVDHCLSRANNRLYRQSRVYQVKVDLDLDLEETGVNFEVFALRTTWPNMKAYQFAYEKFLENSKEERSEGNDARWNDFRVKSGSGAETPTRPIGFEAAGYTPASMAPGEYEYSEVHDAAGNARSFVWTGATGATQYNIIDEYDLTANTSSDPSSPISTAAYDDLTDEIDDGQRDHLQNSGNEPPYGSSSLDNDCWTKVATLCNSGGPGNLATKLSTGYFDAPCGIILIQASAAISSGGKNLNGIWSITCKSGDYKGVHAPSMLTDARVYASSSKSAKASHNVRMR